MPTKIEWTDETWNPITGCWGPYGTPDKPTRCSYCYAKRMARRLAGRHGYPPAPDHFTPTFHPDRLETPYKWRKPRRVFVCSMSDFFHPHNPDEWRQAIFDVIRQTPQHTYQLLTKCPAEIARWNLPANVWVGVTATGWLDLDIASRHLRHIDATLRFVSAEPWLQKPGARKAPTPEYLDGVDWLIVGQQTGNGAGNMPDEVVNTFIELWALADERRIPVFVKPPLYYRYPVQEWPEV